MPNLPYEERTVPCHPPKSVGAAARRRVPVEISVSVGAMGFLFYLRELFMVFAMFE